MPLTWRGTQVHSRTRKCHLVIQGLSWILASTPNTPSGAEFASVGECNFIEVHTLPSERPTRENVEIVLERPWQMESAESLSL